MIEQSFIIIKPDCYGNEQFYNEFVTRLKEQQLELTKIREIKQLDKDKLKQHYSHIADKDFYPNVERYMTSGPVEIGIVEGVNAVSLVRSILGATDPRTAEPNSLRWKYGKVIDNQIQNCCHASDSIENAQREINIWYN